MAALPDKFIALDTETTGLHRWRGDRPFAVGGWLPNNQKLFWRDNFDTLRPIVEDPDIDKVFTNAKFDMGMLEALGMTVRGKVWDTTIFCHLLDGRDAEGGLNLDHQAKKYLPVEYRKVVEEIDLWFDTHGFAKLKRKQRYALFQQLPNDILYRRVTGDAELTGRIFMRLFPTVSSVFPYLLDLEHRLIPIVKRMEDRGVEVDLEEVEDQRNHFESIVDDVTEFAQGILNIGYWNINSPNDQRELLETAGIYHLITEWTKPKKNRKSTKPFVPKRKLDAFNLQQLHHPVAAMLLVGKMAQKMISPFLNQCEEYAVDSVLHPSYKQCGTTSGRFSCAQPNLQNIPTEGDRKASYTEAEAEELYELTGVRFAPHIKRIFKVRDGYCHLHTDKKQAEMVALAHYTGDQHLMGIFARGESIHDGICKLLFGEITKGLKTRSKMCTFGYQYGAGPATIAKKIGGSVPEARKLTVRYAQTFPSLPAWREALEEELRDRGYITTIHGRRHYLKAGEEYMAVNRKCQGTVGDEIKSRMVVLGEELEREKIDARIVLNIHDDLATEVREEEVRVHGPRIFQIMQETGVQYRLPMPSSMDITYTRWSDLKEVERPHDPSSYPSRDECIRALGKSGAASH